MPLALPSAPDQGLRDLSYYLHRLILISLGDLPTLSRLLSLTIQAHQVPFYVSCGAVQSMLGQYTLSLLSPSERLWATLWLV